MNEKSVESKGFRFRWYHFLLGMIFSTLFAFFLAFWWLKSNLYADKHKPVKLSQTEQVALDKKINQLQNTAKPSNIEEVATENDNDYPVYSDRPLEAEAYSEKGASREIILSQRELNALIANNPEMSEMVAVDLSKDLLSLKILVPMDQDIIFLGGKTLKLKAGVALSYADSKPVVALQGVTLGGVPMPNAWLGGLKYENLVKEFGDEGGFWEMFSKGVEDLEIVEGGLRIKLRE